MCKKLTANKKISETEDRVEEDALKAAIKETIGFYDGSNKKQQQRPGSPKNCSGVVNSNKEEHKLGGLIICTRFSKNDCERISMSAQQQLESVVKWLVQKGYCGIDAARKRKVKIGWHNKIVLIF